MADLRKLIDVQSLKAPTRPLIELLRESTKQAQAHIAQAGSSPERPVPTPPARAS
jgi:hypothetical protein